MAEILVIDLHNPQEDRVIESDASLISTPIGAPDRSARYLSAEDRLYVDTLLREGLFQPRSKNKAHMLLTRYYYELGYSKHEICEKVIEFFLTKSNGLSNDWNQRPAKEIENVKNGVRNWLRKAKRQHTVAAATEQKRLDRRDVNFIYRQRLKARDRRFLSDAMEWILNNKRGDRLVMSSRQMFKFANCNSKNYQSKREILYSLRILALEVEQGPDSGLANEYRVLHSFDEPRPRKRRRAPSAANRIDSMVRSGKSNAEVRNVLPAVSRQHVHARRQALDQQARTNREAL